MVDSVGDRLLVLEKRGVIIVDPRQTYIDDDVVVDRISARAVLYPGTRLSGGRTFVGPGARIGSEGPAVLKNSVLGENTEVASGFLNEAVLLPNARVGANAHIREGTLLEEQASTAHAVGLKHSILLSYVTLGSLINFCDGLISGGSSRRDHSEVGSGFIHFNYTPWGQHGDKATPSLVGDAVRGVFLREDRIFLGGSSGLVGPQKIGFGSITIAGQVIRKEVHDRRMVYKSAPEIDRECNYRRPDPPGRRTKLNLEYIGQLVALKGWYEQVRLRRIPASKEYEHLRIVTSEALKTIEVCIRERIDRLRHFLAERGHGEPDIKFEILPCLLNIDCAEPYVEHVDWVRTLPDHMVEEGKSWLKSIADSVICSVQNTPANK